MQKAVRRDHYNQAALPGDHPCREDAAHGGSVAPRGRAERREIVLAPHRVESARHRDRIQRPRHVPGVPTEERIGKRSTIENVRVALASCGSSRVESSGSLAYIQHADRGREQRVQSALEASWVDCRRGREAGDLPERVHAGIGPARANYPGGRPDNPLARSRDQSLNRRQGRLPLPAVKLRAVVRERESERPARHALPISGSGARRSGSR